MKLTCMFSFTLLFGATGLILFIHLQDLSEIVQQQIPGSKLNLKAGQTTRKDLCTYNSPFEKTEESESVQRPNQDSVSGPVSPMQFPAFDRTQNPKPHNSRELEGNVLDERSAGITKRQRQLLLKNNPYFKALNSSTVATSVQGDTKWDKLYKTQEERKHLIRDVCAKYKSNSKKTITPHHVSRIFVEDKHKLLYCEVPKTGCSNWKRVLMVLEGFASSVKDIQHNTVHNGNHLRRLDSFDKQGIHERLNAYTKVLFVREPFERLVSAFRDKFEHPNSYYHPVFGKPIISKYRVNASRAALRTGSDVTFKEFLQYLLDVHKPVGMDIHWDHVNRLCSPCLIDYDFIGKSESMREDANFLLHLTDAPKNLTFPTFKDRHSYEERTTTKITQQYFAQIAPSDRQRAYDFYYMDYLMFNYSKPFKDLY
ncbi:carbohydrate sulfotransferase 8-like isoform X1 [Acipenser oxyrinchus oxyrinchus]|uniref:Carbohydrate sulfotransferase n=1 Tax=Acipenser oxyrinchus oxyrinchus TaxID=40147 RepID=A0AAD8D6D4_ACIOX|nr:carbohydrate sulfotransferase 8-like isoform X1 [Acipenser oxyrinchus oxyrinchus]